MTRPVAVAGLALLVATSTRGMTPAPVVQPDCMITPVTVTVAALPLVPLLWNATLHGNTERGAS
jgi:hypothetical protein